MKHIKQAIKMLSKSIRDMSFEDIPKEYAGIVDCYGLEQYLSYYAMEQGYDPYDYPEEEINEDSPDFKEWLKRKIEDVYFDVEYNLYSVINLDNTVDIYRAMTVREDWVEHLEQQGKHLGIYWSYDPDAIEAHWGRGDQPSEVYIHGKVPETSVDWESTFMLNMDPSLGEEKEIRLYDGVPIEILEISMQDPDKASVYDPHRVTHIQQDISALEGKTFYA